MNHFFFGSAGLVGGACFLVSTGFLSVCLPATGACVGVGF